MNVNVKKLDEEPKPRYRMIIANLDKGEIVMDVRVFGVIGAIVEEAPDDRGGFAVYDVAYVGRLSPAGLQRAILALKHSLKSTRSVLKNARRMIRGGKYEQ